MKFFLCLNAVPTGVPKTALAKDSFLFFFSPNYTEECVPSSHSF